MDLAYLAEHPHLLPAFRTHQRIRETPVAGGSICRATRLTLDNGESLFVKELPEGAFLDGFFHAEACGLRWLTCAGGLVPEVIVELPDLLGLSWIEPGPPTPATAEDFGRMLAELHGRRPSHWGAAWKGFHGSLPMDNEPSSAPWHEWYAERRLIPYLRSSVDNNALSAAETREVERVLDRLDAAGDEPPARIHGDLWPGNLLWGADGRCRLIDPAAHGGHRETDLAYLQLWGGAPFLDRILAAYQENAYQENRPLRAGWEERLPLHQLSMYLLHTALFGAAFAPGVRETAGRCP